ncbi:hypothetical protein OIU79_021356 [Salix purpurea]|uniref:Uncharacterized protein n=1 Tax=Salix purpurea TaxID=77065 RepID=A0A9Q0WNP9_SALPP|nr:hypothetical protein OIU79_021356 [Salix purpurea]
MADFKGSSNLEIRIQAEAAAAAAAAAAADAVPVLEHTLENLGSDQISAPSSFEHRVALVEHGIINYFQLENHILNYHPNFL